MEPTGVPEFFAGRCILVTGATGFMGKVLLEKLLHFCPDISRIYILVRVKRGVAPRVRLDAMTKLPIFDKLRRERPNAFSKVEPLEGEVGEKNLGLRPEDQRKILDNVSVVFHLAASLDFRASLKKSVTDNTIGTMRVLDFCSQIKNLVSFVYTSTAFCHPEMEVLEERVYEPPVDPDIVVELSQKLDESAGEALRPKLLGLHPNCYTFTKSLAEYIVDQNFRKGMPICIARPSIVLPVLRDPCPGWVDTLNGPIGVLVASGKGVMRSMMCDPKHHAEVIPVDVAINAIIALAKQNTELSPEERKETPVYNMTTNDVERITWGEVLDMGRDKVVSKYPFEWTPWYPDGAIRTNWWTHTLIVFFFQTVPAYFIDFIFLLLRRETFMVRVQRKIKSSMGLLHFFTMRDWDFRNKKGVGIWHKLNKRDQETFYINNVTPVDRDAYFDDIVLGTRTYCLKEPESSLKHCRIRIRIQYVIHRICVMLFYIYLGYLGLKLAGCLVNKPALEFLGPIMRTIQS